MQKIYTYGMRLRGFSPGAQPTKNLIAATDDPMRKFYSIVTYSSPLDQKDIRAYELEPIDEREIWYSYDEIS